jgi:hypothetical protein
MRVTNGNAALTLAAQEVRGDMARTESIIRHLLMVHDNIGVVKMKGGMGGWGGEGGGGGRTAKSACAHCAAPAAESIAEQLCQGEIAISSFKKPLLIRLNLQNPVEGWKC